MLLILTPRGGFHAAGFSWQLLILLGCLAWSLGTIYYRNSGSLNPPLMFVALQMLAGGIGLLLVVPIAGEPYALDWTPRAFALQSLASGQTSQRGFFGKQTLAPKSINAWLKSAALPLGKFSYAIFQSNFSPSVELIGFFTSNSRA